MTIEELEKENDLLKQQVTAMRRVHIERANAARGITPKKEHDGYTVLDVRDWREHYTRSIYKDGMMRYDIDTLQPIGIERVFVRRQSAVAVDCCKVTVQTPYDVQMPRAAVWPMIEEDIYGRRVAILADLGIEDAKKGDEYADDGYDGDDVYEVCTLYRTQLHANYRTGLWECDLYTSSHVIVPEGRAGVVQQTAKQGK